MGRRNHPINNIFRKSRLRKGNIGRRCSNSSPKSNSPQCSSRVPLLSRHCQINTVSKSAADPTNKCASNTGEDTFSSHPIQFLITENLGQIGLGKDAGRGERGCLRVAHAEVLSRSRSSLNSGSASSRNEDEGRQDQCFGFHRGQSTWPLLVCHLPEDIRLSI